MDDGVPTVSELKAQARASEETGDPGQAIALYEQILEELAESPGSLDEVLTICTRVGDLRVQLRQPARAFASYRQAAEYGAQLGSSEQVISLCGRMVNVVPAAGDSYPRYARRLFEYGHVDPALDVLAEFADKASLDTVREAVASLVGRTGGDRGSHLEELLSEVEREASGVFLPPLPEPVTEPRPPSRESRVSAVATAARESVTVEPVQTPVSRPSETRVRATMVGRPRSAGFGLRISPRMWLPVGVVGAIALVVLFIVTWSSGSPVGEVPATVASVDTLSASLAVVSDSAPAAEPEAATQPVIPAASANRPAPSPPPQPDPAPVASTNPQSVASNPPAPAVNRDTAAAPPPVVIPPISLPDASDADSASIQPIVAGDLSVVSVTAAAFRGLSGFRVIHRLATGGQFVVESYPVDSNTAILYPLGTTIINVVPPDTTVSIVRFDEQYLVFASGVLPEDSLRVLLGTLRVRDSAN